MKKKSNLKKIILFIVLTTIFSFLIFIIKNYLFWWFNDEINKQIEDNYIDPSISFSWIINEDLLNNFNSANTEEISYIYNPDDFSKDCKDYSNTIWNFLENKKIKNKINEITIEINKDIYDTRGKMKNKSIKLFWILKMTNSEFLSVSIHEFGHYLDIYYLEKKLIKDLSDYFYNISWESTKVLKAWQLQEDFVSGYAMTNKYEDFAESFIYYILHNKDFLEKTKKSKYLKAKYNYFTITVFPKNEFIDSDFSENNIIEDYYRDITKINYNLENFLQYLKNKI